MSTSKFHIVIPARYGSSRLPGKPIVDLGGKPMVVRVFEKAKSVFISQEVIVAIDDYRIAEVLERYSVPWTMTRSDHQSGTDRIAEVCILKDWDNSDLVINLQGDEPLVPEPMLLAFYDYLRANISIDIATVSTPLLEPDDIIDPNVVKVVCDQAGYASFFSRSPIPFIRDLPDPRSWPLDFFRKHIGIYAYKVDVLKRITNSEVAPSERAEKLEQLRALWLGYSIGVFHWNGCSSHGVDTLEDVERVIKVLKG